MPKNLVGGTFDGVPSFAELFLDLCFHLVGAALVGQVVVAYGFADSLFGFSAKFLCLVSEITHGALLTCSGDKSACANLQRG